MAVKPGCRALREQDEYHCAFCNFRWDVADEAPQCKSIQERLKPGEGELTVSPSGKVGYRYRARRTYIG